MNYWLKLIGSSDKPITEHPFYGKYEEEYIGFRKQGQPGIKMGDHIFLYAPGGSKSIFALAEAMSQPEHDNNCNLQEVGSCPWKLRIRYLMNLPVAYGVCIDDINSENRILGRSIRQQSHIKLSQAEYKLAYEKLQEKVGTFDGYSEV